MSVAIISDTHMPKGRRRLPDRCLELLAGSELILHAGDWSTLDIVEQVEAIGPPVAGVGGNVDSPEVRDRLPERLELEWSGIAIAMVHDAGARKGRIERMRRELPDADLVVFGHSHLPLHETADDGFQIFNPGSPTERRRAPSHSMGLLELDGRGRPSPRLITLD